MGCAMAGPQHLPTCALTLCKQKLHSAQVSLRRGHHQWRPALLVCHVHISAVREQEIHNLQHTKPGHRLHMETQLEKMSEPRKSRADPTF